MLLALAISMYFATSTIESQPLAPVVTNWTVARSKTWALFVNEKTIDVLDTNINRDHEGWSWDSKGSPSGLATFDLDGKCRCSATLPFDVETAELLPQSSGIRPSITGRKVSTEIPRPGCYILRVRSGAKSEDLHLFVTKPLRRSNTKLLPNTKYFGPGEHFVGEIRLTKSCPNLVIDSGAIVHGLVRAESVDHIRISGRGLLDASDKTLNRGGGRFIELKNCHDAQISDTTLLDNPNWNIVLIGCNRVKIQDVKIVAARAISDGIDIVNSSNISIDRCFIRNWDDGVAIKGIAKEGYGQLPVRNIAVTNSIFVSDGGWSSPFAVGYETYAPDISNVSFKGCEVLYCRMFARFMLAEQSPVRNFLFENIRAYMPLPHEPFKFLIGKDKLSEGYKNEAAASGSIRSIRFKNCAFSGGPWASSNFRGLSENCGIDDIVFQNVSMNGTPLQGVAESQFHIDGYVRGIQIRP